MNLAVNVVVQDMKAIALADFGIDAPKVNNRALANDKNPENFNFEILSLWRNKTVEKYKKGNHDCNIFSGIINSITDKINLIIFGLQCL